MVGILRFASATAYLFVISGWLVLAAFFGPRKFRLLDTLAISFITSLAVTSLVATGAHLLGADLTVVAWIHLTVSIVAGSVAAWRAGPVAARRTGDEPIEPLSADERRWEAAAAAIVVGTAVLSWVEGLWLRMSDLFYHIAAVASLLAADQPLVTDPFFGLKNLPVDPTSGTFHTFLALAAKLGGITAFQAFEWLEPVVVACYFLAFYAFARRLLGSASKALFALALFAGVVWSLDFRVVIYSKWLDPAVYWMGLVFFLSLMERMDWRALLFATVFAATTALVHLATAELWFFAMLAAVAWSLLLMRWVKDGRGVALRCLLGAGVSMAVLVPVVYRRSISVLLGAQSSVFNPPANSPMSDLPFLPIGPRFGIIRGGTWYQWYQGGDVMLLFVVGALALIVVSAVRRGAKPATVLLAAQASIMPALMLNLVATKLILAKYWFHLRRMAYVLRAVPALLLPWTVAAMREERRGRASKPVLALGIATAFVGVLAFTGVEVIGVFNRFVNPLSLDHFDRQRHNVVRQMDGLTRYLQPNTKASDVVAAHEKTSYYLAGLVPVRIIAVRRPHMPLAVEVRSGPKRRYDQAQILNAKVTGAKTLRLLDEYDVTHVVVAATSPVLDKFDALAGVRRVWADKLFVVYEVTHEAEPQVLAEKRTG